MIRGDRVFIRQMELGDEELLHCWRNDPEIMAYSEMNYGFLRSKEAFRLEVRQSAENPDMFPVEKTFIICRSDDGTPIGDITYRHWDRRNRSAEVGLEIAEIGERGKGYGCDALRCFIDFMFRFLNLNRVELKTLADNVRAKSLYEKLGFRTIGIIRQAVFDSRTGRYSDYIYMDLIRDEWVKDAG